MNRAEQNWPTDETIEMSNEDELVPFGDYYVTRAKRERSQQLRAALAALETPSDRVLDYVKAVRETGSVFEPLHLEVR